MWAKAAGLLVLSAALAGCSRGADVQSAWLADDGRTLRLAVGTCNADLTAALEESPDGVVVRVDASGGIDDTCLDGMIVTLAAPLGGRSLIDRHDRREIDVIPESIPRLWSFMAGGEYGDAFSSILEMAQSSDVVVVGSVSDVAPGREWDDPQPNDADRVMSLLIEVTVAEVVRGELSDTATTVEFPLRGQSIGSVSAAVDNGSLLPLPGEEAIWYLRVSPGPPNGFRSEHPSGFFENRTVYELVSQRGLIVDNGGLAAAPLAYGDLNVEQPDPLDVALAAAIRHSSFTEIINNSRG